MTILAYTTQVLPGESIQNALDSSVAGDTVLIMPGFHYGTGENLIRINHDHNGIVLLGNEQNPSSVILSGDNISDSIIDIDCTGTEAIDTTMVISGFTFLEANASIDAFGGAIHTKHSSPLIKFSLFNNCKADNGGAIYCWKGNPVIRNCSFQNNECLSAGAAIYLYTSNGSISHSSFSENVSWDDGGAIFCYHSSPVIFNCIFQDGYAHDDGGGIYCYALSNPEISFCTIVNNYALYTGSAVYFRVNSSPILHHNIVTGNAGPAFYIQDGGNPVFEYNCVWDNPDGNYGNLPDPTGTAGNISENPLFVTDFYLSQTAAGQSYNSPCVNAGEKFSEEYNLEQTWTRTDSIPDTLIVDLGYHHGNDFQMQSGSQPQELNFLQISPNPTSGSITITIPDNGNFNFVEFFDLSGRLVLKHTLQSTNTTIQLGNTNSSSFVYLLRVTGENTSNCLTGRITYIKQ